MSKTASAKARRRGFTLTLTALIMLTMGALLFYFASQAFTPENAHLTHWGLGALGGFLGWAIGTVADRYGSRSKPHRQ